uniref:MarR family winged helix-turn-helix transcriptional regulator n=1 Tax=Flavobacterium sp. TaxID=239 RepID=UPI00404AC949
MKIEDVIKSNSPLSIEKRTVLNIFYTHQSITESFLDVVKTFDISMEQFNVLRILRGQHGKPANMCIIQERMVAKTSNTTRLVDKLLAKEYVERAVCAENRRKIEITITKKGLDLLETLDPLIIENEKHFAENLTSEELTTLNDLLEKFRTLNP